MKFPYFYFDISCGIYRTLESLFDSHCENVYVSPPLRILQFCIIVAVKLNRKTDRMFAYVCVLKKKQNHAHDVTYAS